MSGVKWFTLNNGDCINKKMIVKLEAREEFGEHYTIVTLADGSSEVLHMHISDAKVRLEGDGE